MNTSASNTVVITGASRGIGAATARLAAARGFSVAVNYATGASEAEAVVRDVQERVCWRVTDPSSRSKILFRPLASQTNTGSFDYVRLTPHFAQDDNV